MGPSNELDDLLNYARFHLGDGTAGGERLLGRESLEQVRAPQLRKQSTDDEMGIGWHLRTLGGVRTASHGGTLSGHILLLEIVPERNFGIAVLTNANTGWRVIQDVEREALKSYLGLGYARRSNFAEAVAALERAQQIAHANDRIRYWLDWARAQRAG